jgi:hypothetical protein
MIMEDVSPEWVVNSGCFKEFNPIPVHFSVEFMSTLPRSTVGLQFLIITKIKPNNENATPTTTFVGWMAQVRVDNLTRGSINTQFNLVLENLINFSLTWLVGGGQRLQFFCFLGERREGVDHKASSPWETNSA